MNTRITTEKQKTISLSVIAIAAVLLMFAAGPLVTSHQAYACWGGGWGGGCCGCCGGGWGGGGWGGGGWGGGGW
jgi:hypothetical protein